ncbi:MAG: winged helix-turn-helix transcriptional regulator [Candidatus Thermoplasmatota archaeon]
MCINKNIIEIEGQRGILQIILTLHENGETVSGELYNNSPKIKISNNTTAKRAIKILQKHNLVKKRISNKNRAIYYKLTHKGEEIAECIHTMEKILKEL